MFRVTVTNNIGQTYRVNFLSLPAALDWIEQQELAQAFGPGDRWVIPSSTEEEAQFILEGIPSRPAIVPDGDEPKTEYFFEKTYSTSIEDISAELASQRALIRRANQRAFGEQMIDRIASMNDAKGLNIAQVDAFMMNPLIVNLREHLWAGNIETFVEKLQTTNVSAFFNEAEKQAVITDCQNFLASMGN